MTSSMQKRGTVNMLALARKVNESIILNDNIEVALEKAKSLHIWDHQEQLLEGKR